MFLNQYQPVLTFIYKCTTLLLCMMALLSLLSADPAYADHLNHYASQYDSSDEEDDHSAVPQLSLPGVEGVNKAHSYLSSTIEAFSQGIDTFFGEDRVYEEATGTYVQARSNMILSQGGDLDQDVKFRVKLRLPQLKSKLKLSIENDNERGNFESFNRDSKGSNLTDEFESTNLNASLQYMLKEKENLNMSLRPGLKFSDPIEAFLRFRVSKERQLNRRWLTRGTTQLGYFSEDGWENDWKAEFERRTGKRDLFRMTSNILWRESEPGNQFLGQTFLLTHVINTRHSLAYEIGVTGETRPSLKNMSYFGNIRYRRDIHRGWVFVELRPRVIFARENDFHEEISLVMTFEVLFGKNYSH